MSHCDPCVFPDEGMAHCNLRLHRMARCFIIEIPVYINSFFLGVRHFLARTLTGGNLLNYNTLNELKIVVLCGGLSTERNISFLTGSRVCGALRARGHKAVLPDLYMGFDCV